MWPFKKIPYIKMKKHIYWKDLVKNPPSIIGSGHFTYIECTPINEEEQEILKNEGWYEVKKR